jgi:hypothetical protein
VGDQQHHANPIVVGQAFENGGWCQMVSHCSSQRFDFTGTNILMRSWSWVRQNASSFAGHGDAPSHI